MPLRSCIEFHTKAEALYSFAARRQQSHGKATVTVMRGFLFF